MDKQGGSRAEVSGARVVVSGWELSHNAAGRAVTLVELYQRAGALNVSLIGCIFPKWGRQLWPPLQGMPLHCDALRVLDMSDFFRDVEALVERNPADIVHLSKPRLPNIVIGLLYKQRWGAKVIVDIDDEELGFVGADAPLVGALSRDEYPEDLTGKRATQLSVGLAGYFDGITVSNPALRSVYGGEVIPHARDERLYSPSAARRTLNRELFGIPQDVKVVLFSGTPRKHKGILDIAQALADLERPDVLFVLVGDFPFADVKDELKTIKGVNLKFIPGQPYWHTADVLATADCVVLVQNLGSLSAQYQAPAKLTDALAMGVSVLAQTTPALEHLFLDGAFMDVSQDDLKEKLAQALEVSVDPEHSPARRIFLEQLSTAVVSKRLAHYVDTCGIAPCPPCRDEDLAAFRKTIIERDVLSPRFVDFVQQSVGAVGAADSGGGQA